MAIIDGAIEQVDAARQPGRYSCFVTLVGGCIRLAEVGTEPDRRQLHLPKSRNVPLLAKVSSLKQAWVAPRVSRRRRRCYEARNHGWGSLSARAENPRWLRCIWNHAA